MFYLPLYNSDHIENRLAGQSSEVQDGDYRRCLEAILGDPRGPLRRTLQGTDAMFLKLRKLETQAPAFSEAIEVIARAAFFALCSQTRLRLPPLLFTGAPGIGKTWVAQEIAKALGAVFIEHSLATGDDPGVLLGHSSSWKGAQPGLLARTLLDTDCLSPVILVDEVDKASDNQVDPLAGFHALLETQNSRNFMDGFLQVPIRADFVVWIMTANDRTAFRPSLLDRMLVFDIGAPDPAQEIAVFRGVYQTLVAESEGRIDAEIDEACLAALIGLSARQAKRALMLAFGIASTELRIQIRAHDIKEARQYFSTDKQNPVGFLDSGRS